MYKLAKFRKDLKENVSEARYKRIQETINDFKSCFYVMAYIDRHGYTGRSVRFRWDHYYRLRKVIATNRTPYFWAHTKENMKYGQ
ncbi:hypothetical protein NVP1273O_72 [Vibrio phage 1.273.O._10N.286.54.C7]|nr:hypothetical protein NVP1273O_72 [Vibrio phage 1.273.O._10N.286.54.C7]